MKYFLYLFTFFFAVSTYAEPADPVRFDDALTTLGGAFKDSGCVLKTGDGLFNATLCIGNNIENGTNQESIKQYELRYEPTQFFNTNKAESLLDQFDEAQLKARYGNERYDQEKSVGIFQINFRGLPMLASFPVANSSQLLFWVPALGIKEEFNGVSRVESLEKLRDFLKKGDNASRILTELSRVSPVAPDVQLINEMSSTVFGLSVATRQLNLSMEKRTIDPRDILDPLKQVLKEKAILSETGEIDLQYLNIPWATSILLQEGQEIIPHLTFGYTKIGEAADYRLMLGLGYKRPVSEQRQWFLTFSIDYGLEGSDDLASVAHILSPSLTSEALIWGDPKSSSWTISMANMLGYYKSLSFFEYQGYDLETKRGNTILRNGLIFSKPLGVRLLDKELAADMYVIDARSFGDEMYEDQYNRLGFAIGFRKKISTGLFGGDKEQLANAPQTSLMRLSVEHHRSDVSDGWNFSFGYTW